MEFKGNRREFEESALRNLYSQMNNKWCSMLLPVNGEDWPVFNSVCLKHLIVCDKIFLNKNKMLNTGNGVANFSCMLLRKCIHSKEITI